VSPEAEGAAKPSAGEAAVSDVAKDVEPPANGAIPSAAKATAPIARAAVSSKATKAKPTVWESKREPPEEEERTKGWVIRR
jgi:hypothetical protein